MDYFNWLTILSLLFILFVMLCLLKMEQIIRGIQKTLRDIGRAEGPGKGEKDGTR